MALIVPLVIVLLALLVVTVVFVGSWLLIADTTFEPASPPLETLAVKHKSGRATEIRATLAPGQPLAASVDLRVFEGFDPLMSPEEAERRHGPPTGFWTVPPPRVTDSGGRPLVPQGVPAPFYDGPYGRVTLRPYVSRGHRNWMLIAYPKPCTLESLFPDERLRVQIARHLSPGAFTRLDVYPKGCYRAFTVSLDSHGCAEAQLLTRDAVPAPF